jgi:D-glycero-alpha-D-manno-heptose-7-phosphate kinase
VIPVPLISRDMTGMNAGVFSICRTREALATVSGILRASMGASPAPLTVIHSAAPVRVVDNGGWTDTWFARYGRVFNIAVSPFAEVQIEAFPAPGGRRRITVVAENYGDRFDVTPGKTGWGRHPLLEAAIELMQVPKDLSVQITIHSEAPAGASTGTSAAVTVALIGALDRLTGGAMSPHDAAYAAHHVEMEMVGFQCGIQDQICSAYGGINFIEMDEFPHATVSQIQVSDAIRWELERRLVLIYLGTSHRSSDLHAKVIRELESEGPASKRLEALRQTPRASRDALCAGDFAALGRAMIENTDAQGGLHPDLIGSGAREVIEIASRHGAEGWKVNGAGGEGGSVSILAGSRSDSRGALIRDIEQTNPLYRNIPIRLSSSGLRVWEVSP